MKDLRMRMDRNKTELLVEDFSDLVRPKVRVKLSLFGWGSHIVYLSPYRAEQLRNWLTWWLTEQKKRK